MSVDEQLSIETFSHYATLRYSVGLRDVSSVTLKCSVFVWKVQHLPVLKTPERKDQTGRTESWRKTWQSFHGSGKKSRTDGRDQGRCSVEQKKNTSGFKMPHKRSKENEMKDCFSDVKKTILLTALYRFTGGILSQSCVSFREGLYFLLEKQWSYFYLHQRAP